ncbi:Alcohol dehydrogenase [Arcticibacter svalbardensis MN12-7]|uniref:Alcohol dehydrogenase n=1 Tax=Arcticibacter svalbardensis MN12-7 TaxID=1150600 RepID=R9GQM2_9SPHI|nr:YhdH/YhfP family quinone oxidoreductase [Arcticibacter svalbardensis]EOR94127.1 Alcohol dehydrogenase [Arcticibacter svalbardensis MN12-7]
MHIPYKAFEVTEEANLNYTSALVNKFTDELQLNEVLIKVHYSSINYKDALSASGNKGVTKNYPHTPGIDAAGIVEESSDPSFNAGDQVIVTGYDLGMNTSGGFAEYIRVPSAWVLHLPENLSLKESMIYGTAGFTAALSVYQLQAHHINPETGPIALTGSTGGVGSIALALLAHLGYQVFAITGKEASKDTLIKQGATEVILRNTLEEHTERPLLKPKYAGVLDTVGGEILANLIKSLNYNGVATCCGLVSSIDLPLTVLPFILKGISLIGIDSVKCEMELRKKIWTLLATTWKVDNLAQLSKECTLETLDENLMRLLKGENTGRIVVKIKE